MDKYDRNLRIAHLNMDVACWEEHIAHNKLDRGNRELYEKAIKEAKEELSKLKMEV